MIVNRELSHSRPVSEPSISLALEFEEQGGLAGMLIDTRDMA